jgi:hypothetical protein
VTTELERIDDHMAGIRLLLPGQFADKPNLDAILKAFINRVQALEDALIAMWVARWLDNAVGAQLDGLGSIVGVTRGNFNDALYKRRIRVRIRANLASGTATDVYEVFKLLLDVTDGLELRDYYPAGFVLTIDHDLSDFDPDELSAYLREARGAGIQGQGIYSTTDEAHMFRFADGTDLEDGSDSGYSDGLSPGDGGEYAGAFA